MNTARYRLDRLPTPVGDMLIVQDGCGRLCALDWEGYAERMQRLLQRYHAAPPRLSAGDGHGPVLDGLRRYLAGDLHAIDELEVDTGGTPFQQRVWRELRTIPCGETITYGQLAARVDRPKASRAVGLANGANPVCVVVPCHRVVGADMNLTGYGGGLARKRWLLMHEGLDVPALTAQDPIR